MFLLGETDFSNYNITIAGLGLIGGSLAKAIRKKFKVNRLWAVDIDSCVLSKAKNDNIIDDGFINPSYPLENSDIVILCTYPNAAIKFMNDNMHIFKTGCIITDTLGIKSMITDGIKDFIRDDIEFIGGHPMSGRESAGYDFSDEKIFDNSNYILTPGELSSELSVNILLELIRGIGVKNITVMTPEEHDEAVAFTSQLPHIIACALMNGSEQKNIKSCTGGSFRDATRVADINCSLWSELIHENKKNILHVLDNFLNDINDIYDTINNDDTENLKFIFEMSRRRRKEMNI